MPLAATVVPGKVFGPTELCTNPKLNQLGEPVVNLSGSVGPADLALTDYSGVLTAGAYFYGLDTGAVNAAAVTLTPAPGQYSDGLLVAFKVLNANTGPATLNVNALGAQAVLKYGNVPLDAGDWQPEQIVVVRYQLDANLVPAGTVYSGAGVYVVPVVIGRVYNWTKQVNDTNCVVDGVTTLTTSGNFTATHATVTLNGTISATVTASVQAVTNVWQQLSPVARRYYEPDVFGCTAATAGERGGVPAPTPGQQNFTLFGSGKWQDPTALIAGQVALQTAGLVQANWLNNFG